MTKSLEALVADMKAAAEKATPGQWVYLPKNTSIEYDVGSDESQGSICYMDSGDFTQRITELNGLHVAAANPENVLKLIAALEQSHTEREEFRHRLKLERSILEDADKRIAELESCHHELRESMGAIHNTIKIDGVRTSLSGLLTASKNAWDKSGSLCVKPTDAMREVAPLCVKLPSELIDQVCLAAAEIHNRGNGVNDDKAQFIIDRIRNYLENGGTVSGSE